MAKARAVTTSSPTRPPLPTEGGVYIGIDPGASGGLAALIVRTRPRLYDPIEESKREASRKYRPPLTECIPISDLPRSDRDGYRPMYRTMGDIDTFFQGTTLVFRPMPVLDADILDWLLDRLVESRDVDLNVFAVLEKVGGYVSTSGGKVNAGQPGSAMFNFGRSYGKLEMAMASTLVPYEEVSPARWQSGLHIPKRDKTEGKTAWKNRLKGVASRLYPGEKVTLATADSILLATYCYRWREGKL